MGEKTESLKNVYGEICWLRLPCLDIVVRPRADELSAELAGDDRIIICLESGSLDWADPRRFGTEGAPFYQLVANLHSAFADEDWVSIRDFYATYGKLGDPKMDEQRPYGERVGWCRHALAWFRSLIELTSILQREDDAALYQWYEECIPPPVGPNYDLVRWSTPNGPMLDRGISMIDMELGRGQQWPKQNERREIYSLVWEAVIAAVQRKLATTHLEPFKIRLGLPQRPVVRWGFRADGALTAAFLQWFFEVFAPFRVQVCERPTCDRPVPQNRRKYCSRACADAHRQQRRRDRLGVAQTSS